MRRLVVVVVVLAGPCFGFSASAAQPKSLHVFHRIKGDVCYHHVPKRGRPYFLCRPKPARTTTTVAPTTTTKPVTTTKPIIIATRVLGATTTTSVVPPPTTQPPNPTTPPPTTVPTTTTAPPPTTTTPATTTIPSGGPLPISATSQWAGYLTGGGTTTSATGSWVVPKLSCSATEALGSTWLGVGGWDGSTLLQIGTYDQCIGGQEQHGAFIEEYPGSEANLPLVFSPGQTVTVSLSQISPGTWAFSINGVSGTAAYSGGGTVSWITEAFGTSGGVPLPVGDATTFSNLTVNGGAAQIAQGFSMPHLSPPAPPNYRLAYS